MSQVPDLKSIFMQASQRGCKRGDSIGSDVINYANQARELADTSIVRQQGDSPPIDLSSGSPFLDVPYDLATISAAGSVGVPASNFNGVKVLYRREGSAAGGRLNFISAGRVTRIYPGCWFTAPVTGGVLQIADNSTNVGTALFTIIKNEGYDFREPPYDVQPATPTVLLGAIDAAGTVTYVTVAENTDPTGSAAPTGSFNVTGFKRIRLLINTLSAAANATSFDLIPWVNPTPGVDNWFEQGTQRVSVPDTDSTGGLLRVVSFDVAGRGLMYFSIRNLLAAARTGLNFCVQGIE
jgi:hypothetical protein